MGKKIILVVEDDMYVRDIYLIQGKILGIDTPTAIDGSEAITKIKTLKPNLVLLDLMLPKVDGMTVLKTIKADPLHAGTQFIITTNLDDTTTEDEAKKLGVLHYLLKTDYTPLKVLEVAKKYL